MTQKTRATVSTYNNLYSFNLYSREYRVEFLNGPQNVYTGGKFRQRAIGTVFEVDDEDTGHMIGRVSVPATDAGNARPREIEAAVRAL